MLRSRVFDEEHEQNYKEVNNLKPFLRGFIFHRTTMSAPRLYVIRSQHRFQRAWRLRLLNSFKVKQKKLQRRLEKRLLTPGCVDVKHPSKILCVRHVRPFAHADVKKNVEGVGELMRANTKGNHRSGAKYILKKKTRGTSHASLRPSNSSITFVVECRRTR